MKLTLSETEAKEVIGSRFNLGSSEVEILFSNPSPQNNHSFFEAIYSIYLEGMRDDTSKINLIKAIRTLTNCNLKEGKEMAERIMGDEP